MPSTRAIVIRTAGVTYCGTLGQWHSVRFSDLILRKWTEGSTTTLASDMASAPKHRLFPSSAKLLSTWALFASSDQRHEDRALV
jgi:hypothetical protein